MDGVGGTRVERREWVHSNITLFYFLLDLLGMGEILIKMWRRKTKFFRLCFILISSLNLLLFSSYMYFQHDDIYNVP